MIRCEHGSERYSRLLLYSQHFFWLFAFRLIASPFLVATWVFVFKFGSHDLRPSLEFWAACLILCFSPIGVLPIPNGQNPRLVPGLVPLVMGLPRPESVQHAKSGEV